MDASGMLFTGLTMASTITTSALAVNMVENFGTLATNGQLKYEVNGPRLVGTYANAVTGMSAVSIGLSMLYIALFIYGWYRNRRSSTTGIQKIYWTVMMLAVCLSVSASGMNLHTTEKFTSIGIETNPTTIVAGENYKLRGSWGTSLLAVNSSALGMSSIAFVWMATLFFIDVDKRNSHNHREPDINRFTFERFDR